MKHSRIRVRNLNTKVKLNEKFIKNVITKILKLLKKPLGTELEVIFLNDDEIMKLNKRYKDRNRPTDVLSFKIDLEGFPPTGTTSKRFLGEILISTDTAFRNAKAFGTAFEKEISLYIVHGILHLFGYDDENPKMRKRMSEKEGEILNKLCAKEDLSKVLMTR